MATKTPAVKCTGCGAILNLLTVTPSGNHFTTPREMQTFFDAHQRCWKGGPSDAFERQYEVG